MIDYRKRVLMKNNGLLDQKRSQAHHFGKNTSSQIIQARLRRIKNEGHDKHAHDGLALTQTGFVKGCRRCQLLKRIEPKKKSAANGQETHG